MLVWSSDGKFLEETLTGARVRIHHHVILGYLSNVDYYTDYTGGKEDYRVYLDITDGYNHTIDNRLLGVYLTENEARDALEKIYVDHGGWHPDIPRLLMDLETHFEWGPTHIEHEFIKRMDKIQDEADQWLLARIKRIRNSMGRGEQ